MCRSSDDVLDVLKGEIQLELDSLAAGSLNRATGK